jgi:hypothetical protein
MCSQRMVDLGRPNASANVNVSGHDHDDGYGLQTLAEHKMKPCYAQFLSDNNKALKPVLFARLPTCISKVQSTLVVLDDCAERSRSLERSFPGGSGSERNVERLYGRDQGSLCSSLS